MTVNAFYNVAGLLAIGSAAAILTYALAHPRLLAEFRRQFWEAMDEGGGPPGSPA
jgi:hypothetical protein